MPLSKILKMGTRNSCHCWQVVTIRRLSLLVNSDLTFLKICFAKIGLPSTEKKKMIYTGDSVSKQNGGLGIQFLSFCSDTETTGIKKSCQKQKNGFFSASKLAREVLRRFLSSPY